MKIAMVLCLTWLAANGQTLRTVAGTGAAGATGRKMDQPFGLGMAPDHALYFCEVGNHRISRLDLRTHKTTVIAGNGEKGYSGDGGPATAATLDEPYELAFSAAGDLVFCDRTDQAIRRVDHKTHIISTIAGTGKAGFGGDGGPAVQAQFNQPHSIVFGPDGHLLICDILNFRIRSLDVANGTIATWAGTGQKGSAPDGAPLVGTALDEPRALAIDKAGNFYLALRAGNAIYRLDVKGGRMYRYAGTGEKGLFGRWRGCAAGAAVGSEGRGVRAGWQPVYCGHRKSRDSPGGSEWRDHHGGGDGRARGWPGRRSEESAAGPSAWSICGCAGRALYQRYGESPHSGSAIAWGRLSICGRLVIGPVRGSHASAGCE